MGTFATFRFGQDAPARIAGSVQMQMEATELYPFEVQYQRLVPFYPPELSSGAGSGAGSGSLAVGAAGNSEWKQYPDRLDLFCYQGDDVQIPLYFANPGDPAMDMSTEDGWTWKGQVRMWHSYLGYLVHDFVITAECLEPDPPDPTILNQTIVTLYLPRMKNLYPGVFCWDLYAAGPYTGPDFPKPDDIPAEDWLQDQLKTWLYGYLYVVPRVTTTDWLPPPKTAIPVGGPIMVTPAGWAVGPNGRVP